MTFEEAWALVDGVLEPHPDAPDLYPHQMVFEAAQIIFELGKLEGLNNRNEIVDAALAGAIREVQKRATEIRELANRD